MLPIDMFDHPLILPQISILVGEVGDYVHGTSTDAQRAQLLQRTYHECHVAIQSAFDDAVPGLLSPQVTRSWDALAISNVGALYVIRDAHNQHLSIQRRSVLPLTADEIYPSQTEIMSGLVPPGRHHDTSANTILDETPVWPRR